MNQVPSRGSLAAHGNASCPHLAHLAKTRSYDDGGRMTGSVYNNGVSETRAYNTDNTLASISYSGAAIGTYSYSWDDNKNKTSETITGTMSNYGFTVPTSGYDDEERLVGWEPADSNLDQSWALSLVGDWDSFTENTTTQSRTHGNAYEILTADSQSVTHDAKGNQTGLPSNLTTSTSGLTLEWDFENKLHAADVDGTSGADILQKFDALGRRISRDDGTTNTIFVPSGQQTIADYTAGTAASSPTYRYVYASYIDEPVMRAGSTSTAKLYYHRNQQYSVTALTDTTATISERYAYDAYGKLTVLDGSGTVLSGSAYGNRYTYTGREWDGELGLYHYRARLYAPETGRFVSRDPIGYVDGPNPFCFTHNSPLEAVDPLGLERVGCSIDVERRGGSVSATEEEQDYWKRYHYRWSYSSSDLINSISDGSTYIYVQAALKARSHIFVWGSSSFFIISQRIQVRCPAASRNCCTPYANGETCPEPEVWISHDTPKMSISPGAMSITTTISREKSCVDVAVYVSAAVGASGGPKVTAKPFMVSYPDSEWSATRLAGNYKICCKCK